MGKHGIRLPSYSIYQNGPTLARNRFRRPSIPKDWPQPRCTLNAEMIKDLLSLEGQNAFLIGKNRGATPTRREKIDPKTQSQTLDEVW